MHQYRDDAGTVFSLERQTPAKRERDTMVALFDHDEDANLGLFETPVSWAAQEVGMLHDDADIRLEKVSAAWEAIARCRYEFDERALDRTVEVVHHALTAVA